MSKYEFVFALTTNGVLLNEEIIRYLIKKKFVIAISLDGDKYNNSYRKDKNGQEIFEKLMFNIELIFKADSEYFSNYVHFISVLHNRNSLEDVKRFLKNKFGKNIAKIGPLNTLNLSKDKISEFNELYQDLPSDLSQSFSINNKNYVIKKELEKILSKYNKFGFSCSEKEYLINRRYYTGTCLPLQKKIFVTSDYYILPCEKISFENNYGVLYSGDKFLKYDVNSIVNKHNAYLSKIAKYCAICYYNVLCSKCMYTIQKNTEDDFVCDEYMNRYNIVEYLEKIVTSVENKIIKL